MDDIYADLDNFNDVNAFEELQKENKDLKLKLEKNSLAMQKLQTDFDHLSSEFKKLERNYSSLLKTARAEVERKTQIISNLNVEKDKLVLNSIHNSRNILNPRRNTGKGKSNICAKPRKNADDAFVKSSLDDSKKEDVKERKEENRLPSIDTVSSTPATDDTNKFDNTLKKADCVMDKTESKENVASKAKLRCQSIRSRRKSMPAFGKPVAKFSSDEDNDDYIESNAKDTREEKSLRTSSRNYIDNVHKISETSGIDEKYSSYHESSRETYFKSRRNRFSDRHRNNRGRYELPPRSRRISPERPVRRGRDYSGDRYTRPYRVLESPPLEKYDSHRRYHDRRINYERDPYESDPYDGKQINRYDKGSTKHKIQDDVYEPAKKRSRLDSLHKYPEELKKSHINEADVFIDDPVKSNIIEDSRFTSCQSPDYIYSDIETQPKEIMNTAETHLEDPRLTSRKYVTKKVQDDKTVICTVVGRNVDLKIVGLTTWGIEQVEVPEPLKKMPVDSPLPGEVPDISIKYSMKSNDMYIDRHDCLETQDVSAIEPSPYRKHENTGSSLNESDISKIKKSSVLTDPHSVAKRVKPLSILFNEMDGSSENSTESLENDNMEAVPEDTITYSKIEGFDTRFRSDVNVCIDQPHVDLKKTSYKEIIESDLLLSDETSDNTEIKNHVNKKSTKSRYVKKQTVENVDAENLSSSLDDGNPEKIILNISHLKKQKDLELTQLTEKKSKPKKKKRKVKLSPTVTKHENVAEIKTRTKIDTDPKEIKAKFSDLFGDSSSLITPEDLGVHAEPPTTASSCEYGTIFEDAVDTVIERVTPAEIISKSDIKVISVDEKNIVKALKKKKSKKNNRITAKHGADIIEDSTTVDTALSEQWDNTEVVIEKSCGKGKYYNILEKTKTCDKKVNTQDTHAVVIEAVENLADENADSVTSTENITKLSDNEVVNTSPMEHVIHLENVSTSINNDLVVKSDVVSTVIISTGMQPDIADAIVKHDNLPKNIVQYNVPSLNMIKDIMQQESCALATSTPYKDVISISDNIESRMTGSSFSSSDSKIGKNCTLTPGNFSSPTNEVTANDNLTDAPDVRIFVRRKRKVLRKPNPC